MNQPVTYLEISSADYQRSAAFFRQAFGWEPQPFAAADYLVAPHGGGDGIDTALLPSRDGQPRAVPIIRVADLEAALTDVSSAGGAVVVPPFALTGVGRGAYVVDPTGVLLGLHHYDAG
jgi:predicted enzyme related to lactoylglutathione lyase